MERTIWVIGKNRTDMLEAQRSIGAQANLRAVCMLTYEKVVREVENQMVDEQGGLRAPTLIILDYDTMKEEESRALSLLKGNQRLQGVPLFFMVHERNHDIDEECYNLGAMVVLHIPFTKADLTRITRTAWQTEVTRNYEKMLQKQASDLQSAREIWKLNHQLETRNQILSQIFGRYFSDDVADVILENPDGAVIGGEKKKITILMSDLRGFTLASENMDPMAVTDLLCYFFEKMFEAIKEYHGTVIEFLGDGILAVFGAPVSTMSHTTDALAAAISMQNQMEKVNEYCLNKKYPHMELGIGIHSGEAFIGNIGSEQMMRYNVIGSSVNVCSRIESACVGGQIYISESSILSVESPLSIDNRRTIAVKGIQKPLAICQVVGIGKPYECYQFREQKAEVKNFITEIFVKLYPVADKMIAKEAIKGVWRSYAGKDALIEVEDDNSSLSLFQDLEVSAEYHNRIIFSNVYGKVEQIDGNRIWIHFTRTNRSYEQLIKNEGCMKQMEEIGLYGFDELTAEECEWSCEKSFLRKEQDFLLICANEKMAEEYEQLLWNGENEAQRTNSRIELFHDLNCHMLLVTWKSKDEVHVLVASDTTKVRALEFMDYLMGDFGLITGDARCASGTISLAILKVQTQNMDLSDSTAYFMKLTEDYFTECICIDSQSYAIENQTDILNMDRYRKKKVMWAMVKSSDVAEPGDEIWFKSLESESGYKVFASDNLYIMVGIKGEIYHIHKKKFENSYEETEEPLDVFEQMLDTIPEIVRKRDDTYISLDEVAHLCYPKDGAGIYAQKLTKRTKVFPVNSEEYFLGREGDYLAARCDDLSDIYIIQGEVFQNTYELAE